MVDVTAKASRHKTKHLSHDDRRFGDLSKWARHQYGDGNGDFILPDNAEGRATALAIVTHQPFKSTTWLFDFCRDRAPWLDPDEIDRKRLRRKKADVLGRELGITAAVREQLGIRSFGACDRTREERAAMAKQRRRQRDRERNQKKRLEAGRQSRADYLAQSVSRTKPWIAAGFRTRRTWERHRVASLSPHNLNLRGDTPATTAAPGLGLALKPWTPDGPPVYVQLAYLIRLSEYRRLTARGAVRVREQAARSELRRVA